MTEGKKKNRRIMKRIGIGALAVLVLMCISTKWVYDAVFARYEQIREVPQALLPMVQAGEQVTFQSGRNELEGTYFAAEEEGRLILLIPGFHAGTDDFLWQIHAMLQKGWSVFCFDPTGTDRSGGRSAVGYSRILQDARAALDAVQPKWASEQLIVAGHSRGAYAASALLEDERVSGAVLIAGQNSAMESIMQPAKETVGTAAYGNWPLLWLYQVMLFGTRDVSFSAAQAISATDKPVLIVQGAEDETARQDSFSIYAHRDEITNPNVIYYVYEQPGMSGHVSMLFSADGTENQALTEEIAAFLESAS